MLSTAEATLTASLSFGAGVTGELALRPRRAAHGRLLDPGGAGLTFDTGDVEVELAPREAMNSLDAFSPSDIDLSLGRDVRLEVIAQGHGLKDCRLLVYLYDLYGDRIARRSLPLEGAVQQKLSLDDDVMKVSLSVALKGRGRLSALRILAAPAGQKRARVRSLTVQQRKKFEAARAHIEHWRLPQALSTLNGLLAQLPDHPELLLMKQRTEAAIERASPVEAIGALKSAYGRTGDAKALARLIKHHLALGDATSAREARLEQLRIGQSRLSVPAQVSLLCGVGREAEAIALLAAQADDAASQISGAALSLINDDVPGAVAFMDRAVHLITPVIRFNTRVAEVDANVDHLADLVEIARSIQTHLNNAGDALPVADDLRRLLLIASARPMPQVNREASGRSRRAALARSAVSLATVFQGMGQPQDADGIIGACDRSVFADARGARLRLDYAMSLHAPEQVELLARLGEILDASLPHPPTLHQWANHIVEAVALAQKAQDDAALERWLEHGRGVMSAVAAETAPAPHIRRLVGRLGALSPRDWPASHAWLETFHRLHPRDLGAEAALAASHRLIRNNEAALAAYSELARKNPTDDGLRLSHALCLATMGRGEEALAETQAAYDVLKAATYEDLNIAKNVDKLIALKGRIDVMHFFADCSGIAQRRPMPQPSGDDQGVVFVATYACQAGASMTALPLAELKQRGHRVVHLMAGVTTDAPTGEPAIDAFREVLAAGSRAWQRHPHHPRQLFFDWNVDWAGRRIEAMGINIWQPIFERLNRVTRRFTFDITLPSLKAALRGNLAMMDSAIKVCEDIRREVVETGTPVRFVASNWQYPPYAAYRIYCQHHDRPDMQFVAVGIGYENYYTNLQGGFARTAAAVNMTEHKTTRAPFIALPAEFEAWRREQEAAGVDFDDDVKALVHANRASVSSSYSEEAERVRARILEHRARGGKVISTFGKIVYDLTVPWMGGPAHTDMADYLNHTIQSAAGADTLVLVKPHPHELRHEIAGRPNQYFLDLIEVPVPDNVILLGHRMFNIADMLPMLDAGYLWNGTTSLELGASGVPVVMCDDWGLNDYPVGHMAPRDRAHYAELVRDPGLVRVAPDHARRCAALLKYMGTERVMFPYPYAQRSVTNVSTGVPVWLDAEVDRYFTEGDLHVSRLADRYELDGRVAAP